MKIGSPFFSGTIRAAVIKTARVKIGSPFFSGTIWAVVIKTPIFPCIIGNVEGARKLQFLNRRSDKATSTPDAAAVEKGAGRESPPALGQGPTDDIRSSPEPVVRTEAQVGPVRADDTPSKGKLAGDMGVEEVALTSLTTLRSEATRLRTTTRTTTRKKMKFLSWRPHRLKTSPEQTT